MNVRESARFAVRGVLANRMRSLLTMSGIVIGVASVIILVAAGQGASGAILDSFSGLGSDTVTVTPSARDKDAQGRTDDGTQIREAELTQADADALLDAAVAPDVSSVAPVLSPQGVTATYRGASHAVGTFTGSTPSYLVNNSDTVQAGLSLSETDVRQRRRVVLLGVTVAKELIGGDGSAIVNETIQLNRVDFLVTGLLTEEGSSGPQDQDDRVIAPVTSTEDTLTGYGSLSSISVRAVSAAAVEAATSEVRTILNARHGVTPATEDFEISSSSAILSAIGTVTTIFTALLGGVAAISLLVGGIGVMNIMLVTVTERTREIGIRKAIGAQKGDIVGQFLLEAVMLSVFGGAIGVVIGVLVGQLKVVGVQLSVAPYSVYLAFGFSVAVGLFFGIYPANRAASLKPIDALRYE